MVLNHRDRCTTNVNLVNLTGSDANVPTSMSRGRNSGSLRLPDFMAGYQDSWGKYVAQLAYC